MNIKILSLSLVLVIANFMHGMTTQERAFYIQELRKANKDSGVAVWTVNTLTEKYMKTNIGQIYLQKWQEKEECLLRRRRFGLDCSKTTIDAFDKAHEDFFGSEGFAPASNESDFLLLKIKNLKRLLSGSDLEVIIEDLEKKSKKLANNKNQIRRIRRAKTNDRVAQYFRSLPEKRIESTMPEYH